MTGVMALASGVPAWMAVAMVLGSVAWLAPNEWRKR